MEFLFKLRYMVLMMGFFACYNGLLYNEFFAIPNDWFGSCYDIYANNELGDVGNDGRDEVLPCECELYVRANVAFEVQKPCVLTLILSVGVPWLDQS